MTVDVRRQSVLRSRPDDRKADCGEPARSVFRSSNLLLRRNEAVIDMAHRILGAISLALFAAGANGATAGAAEVKVLTARLVFTVLREVGPQFERETGHHLNVTEIYGPEFLKRMRGGEPFDADVLILRPDFIDALIRDGKLVAETRTDLVQTGIGVEVRAGAPRPDITSVEGFKKALLEAKSIAYLKNGLESSHVEQLLDRLGIAEAVKPKVTRPESDTVSILAAKGEVELGIAITTQIVTTPGVELVGPLPAELQSYYVFPGAVSATSKAPDAAMSLLKFLKEPAAIRVIRSQGMEPA
jgi:molybdate transport system substrate-binding protein